MHLVNDSVRNKDNLLFWRLFFVILPILSLNRLISSVLPLSLILFLSLFEALLVHRIFKGYINYLWLAILLLILARTVYTQNAIKVDIAYIIGIIILVSIGASTKNLLSLYSRYNSVFCWIIMGSIIIHMVFPNSRLFGYDLSSYGGITGKTYYIVLCSFLICSYALLVSDNSNLRKILIISIALICVLMSGSRSNIITIPLAIVLSILLKTPNKKVLLRAIKICVILAFILAIICVLGERFQFETYLRLQDTIVRYISGKSITNGRNVIQERAWNLFSQKPVFGIGWMNFQVIGSGTSGIGSNAHNMYIQLLCEVGVVGFLMFCIAFFGELLSDIFFLRRNLFELGENEKGLVCNSIAYQIYFLLSSFLHATSYDVVYIILYFVFVCFVQGIKREHVHNTRRD